MSEVRGADDSGRRVPAMSLRWRLTISLDESEYDRDQMAAIIGVAPATISRWTNGHFKRQPSRAVLQQWAMATGVDPDWLITGAAASDFSDPTRTSVEGQPNTGWFSLAASHGAEMSEAATRQGNRRRLVAARAA